MLFSNLFFIQITTSSIGICGCVYSLAFVSIHGGYQNCVFLSIFFFFSHHRVRQSIQSSTEVSYLGNEIKLKSESLKNNLFASNWPDQSITFSKYFIILMEVFKRPDQLMIVFFSLDLELFTQVSSNEVHIVYCISLRI